MMNECVINPANRIAMHFYFRWPGPLLKNTVPLAPALHKQLQ